MITCKPDLFCHDFRISRDTKTLRYALFHFGTNTEGDNRHNWLAMVKYNPYCIADGSIHYTYDIDKITLQDKTLVYYPADLYELAYINPTYSEAYYYFLDYLKNNEAETMKEYKACYARQGF